MIDAAREEKSIAIENGDIDSDGVPFITVACDGSWAKRSYRTKYDSLSGVAVIVGIKTGKVLHVSVKNKHCSKCKAGETQNRPPKPHGCFKNWTGSSSGMEAAGMVEGFVESEAKYGLRYKYMVADGDSSVYKRILEARPYKNCTVEKIECRNHLLRNFCNKIRDTCSNTASGPAIMRMKVLSNLLRLRYAVTKAVQYRKNQAGEVSTRSIQLKKDILNAPSHVFGEHEECSTLQYFCTKTVPDLENVMADLKLTLLYKKLMEHVRALAYHSRSLIYDLDSNIVEQFNSIICKYISGKRINFCLNRSYQGRVSAAVVSRNTRTPLRRIKKHMTNRSPGLYGKRLEQARLQKSRKRKLCKKRTLFTKRTTQSHLVDKDYGPSCQKPDLSLDEFHEAAEAFLTSLKRTAEERQLLEERTLHQSASGEWMEVRRKLLTASNFGQVCAMLPHTSCRNSVKRIIYDEISAPALEYGKINKPVALKELSMQHKIKISSCGLFIDADIPYLGATSDGTIDGDENGIVEVKCPFSCKSISPTEGIRKKQILFWKIPAPGTVDFQINKKHKWFFQIQGQLHITQKQYCLLAVWTPLGMKTEKVYRDDLFWDQYMKPKLIKFYENCMLPELVDPRIPRNMEIKDPKYILDAKEAHILKKQNKAGK